MIGYLTTLAQTYVAHGGGNLTMPRIIFWLLLILWALSVFPKWENEAIVRGGSIIQIILFAILGYYLFGF